MTASTAQSPWNTWTTLGSSPRAASYLTLPQVLAFRNPDHLVPEDISHGEDLWVADREHHVADRA